MFPKSKRLNLSTAKVSGKRYKGQYCALIHDGRTKSFLAGAIISKKISPIAVKRNQLRRKCIHALKMSQTSLKLQGSYLLLPYRQSLDVSFQALQNDIESLVGRTVNQSL